MSISTYTIPAGDDLGPSRHAAVGAWFFGPRAENFDQLEKSFKVILDNQKQARETTYPDTDFITADMKAQGLYQEQIEALDMRLKWVTKILSDSSVPFWSPRYNAHMAMESSMPAVIGYLAGLLHNQNNVATEASAVTTWLETKVGKGLCRMLGYNTTINAPAGTVDEKGNPKKLLFCPGYPIPREADDPEDDEPVENRPIGWGHITCGGSIANLESIWAARNLKFYPLSLKMAIEAKGSALGFLRDKFEVQLCDGTKKIFMDCITWELLNLTPSTVLNIPTRLYDDFGVSQSALTAAMRDYTIQTMGKDALEKHFKIKESPHLFVGATKHYSWPKGAAITGIGSGQVDDVPVDFQARMDPKALDEMLRKAADAKQAIYAVVAIMGSTEHGAVDPLVSVLKLRQKYQKKGLSFVVHCDAAWGGYFAACIRGGDGDVFKAPNLAKGDPGYVPSMALTPYTKKQLEWYGRADSITIDPHKSGYCPYPAGGLCYRDGRMRFLVTWTSPIVFRGEQESIGVYGAEGSKPGAAAVGTWLSHSIIGLDKDGYGTLLGEAIFTCAKLYCHWATMKFKEMTWDDIPGVTAKVNVIPFIMLPAEKEGKSQAEIDEEKEFIRTNIIAKDNEDIMKDERARQLIAKLGGDLQINTFAVNFEIKGKVNTDVIEANYLNNRIFNRTSITDWQDKKKPLKSVKLFLTSSQFAQAAYKECLDIYKRRMGLVGAQDLYALINVTMNPWATSYNFVQQMADEFQTVANEELLHAVRRNVQTPDIHGFIIQGLAGDRVCGVHLPMFNMENHRWQLIISFKLPEKEHNMLRELKEHMPEEFFTVANSDPDELAKLITDGASFKALLFPRIPNEHTQPIAEVEVTDVKVLFKRSLHHENLDSVYPSEMIFYAYSAQRDTSSKPILHIDHFLSNAFDIQLNSDSISIDADDSNADEILKNKGAWLRLVDIHEAALQPLVQNETDSNLEYVKPGLTWKPKEKFKFEALSADDSPFKHDAPVLFKGTLTLGQSVFADSRMINMDAEVKEPAIAAGKLQLISHLRGDLNFGGLSESNASGLVAEYPNDMQMPELRNRNQAIKMGNFRKNLSGYIPPELLL